MRPCVAGRPVGVVRPGPAGYNGRVVDLVWKIVATLGLVALNAYFVASEFAAVTARPGRLKPLAKTSLLARAALRVKGQAGPVPVRPASWGPAWPRWRWGP